MSRFCFFFLLVFIWAAYPFRVSAQGVSPECEDIHQSSAVMCSTRAQAVSVINRYLDYLARTRPNEALVRCISDTPPDYVVGQLKTNNCSNPQSVGGLHRRYLTTCGPDEHTDPITGECSAGCRGREPPRNMSAIGTNTICDGGCEYQATGLGGGGISWSGCFGQGNYCWADNWRWTGNQCGVPTPPEVKRPIDPTKPVCSRVPGASHNECVYPDGRHCVTASTGKRICWGGSDTSTKSTPDGDLSGKRAIAPADPGRPDGIEGGTTTNTTTTINNSTYNTSIVSGGSLTSGQPDTGPGGGGDGDGGGGGAGGGASCGDPPVCTGDAPMCAVYRQLWLQRCDASDDVDGLPGDVGDGELGELQALAGEGDDGSWKWDDSADPLEGHRGELDVGGILGRLDASGFMGGGQCPSGSFSAGGASRVIEFTAICDLLSKLAPLLLALAYFISIKIITKTE